MELQLEQQQIPCLIPCAHRSVEERVSADFVVPDSLPDAADLLLAEGELCLWRLDLSDGSAELEGEISVRICCTDEHGAPMSFPARVPVQLRLRAEAIEAGHKPFLRCRIKSLSAQLLNSRKARVHGTICCLLTTFGPSELSVTTGVSPETQGLFLKKTDMNLPFVSTVEEQVFSAEDTLSLRLGVPADGTLISYRSVPIVESSECRDRRVVLKGRVCTSVLYEDAESRKLIEESVVTPFSFLMDVNGDAAKCAVSVHFTSEEVHCSNDVPGIDTVFHLLAQVICYAEQELECVTDAYSNYNELTLNWSEQRLQSFRQQEPEQILLEEELPCAIEERNVHAVRTSCFGDSVFIAVLLQDAEQKLTSVSGILKTNQNPNDIIWMEPPEVQTGSKGLIVRVPIFCCREATEEMSMKVLSSAALGEKKTMRSSGVTLLRKEDKMDLWELAKTCGSSVEAIRSANSDPNRSGKWIIVPHV